MKKIVFAGGGTAGHVMPNLAVIDALPSSVECIYVGGDGMEKELCEKRGIPFYRIDTVKLRRDAFVKNFAVPFKLMSCVNRAKKLLKTLKPDLVFSKGGYAALPVVLAAKCPFIAHESDVTPGLVTKLSARKAAKVLCAFEPLAKTFNNGVYAGTPLSKRLYNAEKRDLGFGTNKPVLLCVGGSSGAATLNDAVYSARERLTTRFNVVHITGKNKGKNIFADGYKSIEFEPDMPSLYASVDIAVTRAGANALAELIALGIPALAVPLEKASRGDQVENAEYYKNKGAIKIIRERDLSPTNFVAAVDALYADREKIRRAQKSIKVDGTKTIVDTIMKELGIKV